MKTIDLRSDTVTKPTPPMREAIARAEVGDDVYGEDPTVERLEQLAAARLGKQAALLVPSGTMGNQLGIRAQTRHGDVVLAGASSHVLLYESGGAAALSGVQIRTLGTDGLFDGDAVRSGVDTADAHFAPETLVCVENTHNQSGGRVFPLEQVRDVAAAARERGLGLHLDGARIFNAAVATGVTADVLAEPFDTVSFCLSKGLGAPVGSIVCGSAETLRRVHRFRKMFGGGMRQAGFLAAAGIHALEHHVDRLADDHRNARRLAAGLGELGFAVDPPPETNIVVFRAPDLPRFLQETRKRGVWINPIDRERLRAVTHLDVGADDVEDALARIAEGLAGGGRTAARA